jgi:hypothetical protein
MIIGRMPFGGAATAGGGGSLVDGGNARITGTGFGTNTAVIQSLKAVIEAGSAGTAVYDLTGLSAAGWYNSEGNVETSGRQTEVTTSNPFYGTKCLRCANAGTDGRFGVSYDTGAPIVDMFIRDYVRLDVAGGANSGQWKMLRWNENGGVNDDEPANIYCAKWFNGGGEFIYSTATGDLRDEISYGISLATWYEREVRLVPGTQGGSDSRVEFRFRRTSDFASMCDITLTDMELYNSAARCEQLVMHNYQGNGNFDTGAGTTAVRMDGTYVSNGSQKRIYLGNASTWAACTEREIQTFSSWADTQLDFVVSKGWLSSLTGIYGYVADASGTINSSGYTVTAL